MQTDNSHVKTFFKKNGKYFLYTFIILLLIAAIITPWAKSAYESKLEKERAANAPETVWVYITKTGSCYHRDKCTYLRSSKIKISLDEAENDNYRACSKCRPANNRVKICNLRFAHLAKYSLYRTKLYFK